MSKKLVGFEPVFDKNCRVLILGSFPSVLSRKNQFYYGNPKNRFWSVIQNCFNETATTIPEKKAMLLKHNIALWDIVKACHNSNSADSNLKDIVFADIGKILKFASIQKILCNGGTAYRFTKKYCMQNNITVPLVLLPSTSPANTKFQVEIWINELKKLIS